MKGKKFDVIIVGGGPGGIAAAIWCKRVSLHCLILEGKDELGGQLSMIHSRIPDFPGLICNSGQDLRRSLTAHLQELGIAYILNSPVERIEPSNHGFELHTPNGSMFARTVILSTGVARRRFPLADSYDGFGVSYTAIRPLN